MLLMLLFRPSTVGQLSIGDFSPHWSHYRHDGLLSFSGVLEILMAFLLGHFDMKDAFIFIQFAWKVREAHL